SVDVIATRYSRSSPCCVVYSWMIWMKSGKFAARFCCSSFIDGELSMTKTMSIFVHSSGGGAAPGSSGAANVPVGPAFFVLSRDAGNSLGPCSLPHAARAEEAPSTRQEIVRSILNASAFSERCSWLHAWCSDVVNVPCEAGNQADRPHLLQAMRGEELL